MPWESIIFGSSGRFYVICCHSRKRLHHKAENLKLILHAFLTSYPQLLLSTKLNSTTNIAERLLHNPCALGKTSAIVVGKRQLVNTENFCATVTSAWGSSNWLEIRGLFYSICNQFSMLSLPGVRDQPWSRYKSPHMDKCRLEL